MTAEWMGYDWQPQLKFMKPARAHPFDCGAKCMLGCRCGAKWGAAEWVDDAVAAGCELMTEARVDDPEQKRKVIGRLFVDVFQREVRGS